MCNNIVLSKERIRIMMVTHWMDFANRIDTHANVCGYCQWTSMQILCDTMQNRFSLQLIQFCIFVRSFVSILFHAQIFVHVNTHTQMCIQKQKLKNPIFARENFNFLHQNQKHFQWISIEVYVIPQLYKPYSRICIPTPQISIYTEWIILDGLIR